MDMSEFEWERKTPIVHIKTDMFEADVYEMYEMPSSMVTEMLGSDGPAQMELMARLFRLAIIDPSQAEYLDILSFNELSTAMYQWYKKSDIRIKQEKRARTIEDILATVEEVEMMLEEYEDGKPNAPKPKRRKLDKPLNDPGDGIDPWV